MVLDSKKIQYEKIDIAADEDAKQKMRDGMGDPKGLPPQLFNGDDYCGVSLETCGPSRTHLVKVW